MFNQQQAELDLLCLPYSGSETIPNNGQRPVLAFLLIRKLWRSQTALCVYSTQEDE